MKYKRKGQFFTIGAIIAVFLMYLFTTSILKQERISSEELIELSKIEEIISYVNATLQYVNLRDKNSVETIILVKQNVEIISKSYGLKDTRIEYVFDENEGKWNITLIVNEEYVRLIKRW